MVDGKLDSAYSLENGALPAALVADDNEMRDLDPRLDSKAPKAVYSVE